jgi:hypothetical protein
MFGRSRRAVMASWLALGLALQPANAWPKGGEGASESELAAARSLFAEALKDEEAKRFSEALDKFQRVRAVRDTAQVEYRIGSCYEGLGQAAPAYAAFREATVLGQDELKSADVVAAALDRLHALAKHLGWLSLALPAHAPQDIQVRLDDAVVPLTALSDPIVLEPGPHVVTATGGDAAPFRSSIVLPEGAHMALTISLEPMRAAAPEPPALEAPSTHEPSVPRADVALPRPASPGTGRRTAGWITVGTGAALLVGAGVVAIVRSLDTSTINSKCPGGECYGVDPASQQANDLRATRNRALAEGPIAIGLGAVGLLTAGIGAYFVFSSKDASSAHTASMRLAPLVTGGAGGIGLSGEFR